ncbi:MAG: ribonuclease D [bacterium]|jgi:ribonuclease D|nr:HRDC domain-containing protein [Betaproteobacteria bacterium]
MTAPTAEWIDTAGDLAALLSRLRGASRIGLDTEFMRVNTFWPDLALVQLQADGPPALVDPIGCGNLAPLGPLLLDAGCVKIMHSASEDLVALAPIAGAPVAGLFDTQVAAAFAGLGPGLGYQRLAQMLLDVEIGKGETRSDWLQRPLTEQQKLYAAIDVVHLPAMHDLLSAKLGQRSMAAWCQEDCDRLAAGPVPDAEPHLSFTALWKSPPEQQARLRRLLRWREALARRINRPRSWIFDNALATSLVETPPADADALSSRMRGQRSFPKRELPLLLDLLESPLSEEDRDLPPIPPPIRGEPAQQLAQLRDKVAARATELDLPPALLCPRRLLEAWVRGERSPELDGWRGTVLGDLLAG